MINIRDSSAPGQMMLAWTVLNASLPILIDLYAQKHRMEDKIEAFPNNPTTFNLPVKETFDFVIGGGTAGCILARRLSGKYRVLVLEAGGTPPPITEVHYVAPYFVNAQPVNFLFKSIPQKNAGLHLAEKGVLHTSSGRMLGGSSSHNEGHYERGSPHGYDEWAEITGDKSWEYKNVLKYFLKSEDYHGEFGTKNGQHRTGGLLPVTSVNEKFDRDIWFDAGKELGYDKIDSKGPLKVGFSPAEFNVRRGRRMSAYIAFVRPIEKKRRRLTIRRFALVSKVVFKGRQAVGVEYEWHGVPSTVFASKEIILSAGTFFSPIILIKSGIGPKDQLKKAQVAPISILPVGQFMQDHVQLDLPLIRFQNQSIFRYDTSTLSFQDIQQFVKFGTGALRAAGKLNAFHASNRASKEEGRPDWPDLQVYFSSTPEPFALDCSPNLVRPYSHGQLSYNASATSSLEASLYPIIDYNSHSVHSDIHVLIEGVKLCHNVLKTKTFQRLGAKMDRISVPECEKKGHIGSHKYWECYIRYFSTTDDHAVGTARMGKPDDLKAVLDSKLRVLGVTRLRVCDASIMPRITNANIAAPIMMIAEKTAQDILNDWKKKTPSL